MVADVNTFIQSTEQRIQNAISRHKGVIWDFDIQFKTDDIRENYKRYFESKHYIVEMKRCQGCSFPKYDITIYF
jgi:hypothetical protein